MTDRQYKSTQTRCENIYKKLKEEIEPKYKIRQELLMNLQFFCTAREHEKLPELSVKTLNEIRAKLMYDIAIINQDVERITDEMQANHQKKIEAFKDWQKGLRIVNGFNVNQ